MYVHAYLLPLLFLVICVSASRVMGSAQVVVDKGRDKDLLNPGVGAMQPAARPAVHARPTVHAAGGFMRRSKLASEKARFVSDAPVELPRRALLQTLFPLAATFGFFSQLAAARVIDPIFSRLRARYILLRPGETTFEAAGMVDSNPINKGSSTRGLSDKGRNQVLESAKALKAAGVEPTIFFDSGVRATQTADILSQELSIPRNRIEPEFRWLEARGLGALDGTDLKQANLKMRAMDAIDINNYPPESEDGTPSESVNDVFSRLRNTIAKIENTYGGGDFVIIPGDGTVLSVLAAAACGVDLREHPRFELPPGAYYDLRELCKEWREGRFEEKPAFVGGTDEEVAKGRAALQQEGSALFSETAAGSDLLNIIRR